MSAAYRERWNPAVQREIDSRIERYRQADFAGRLPGLAPGREVKIEQMSHDFIFGAHIFNFDQLGSTERNRRYRDLFGPLFNSATIAFYWKTLETEPGKPRFAGTERDTAAYWNSLEKPWEEPHWRRPATDPVVEFCLERGIRLHGHPFIWGSRQWHHPPWIEAEVAPPEERAALGNFAPEFLQNLAPGEIAARAPVLTAELHRLFSRRISEIVARYGDRIHSWDVVNESATDFARGNMVSGEAICKSHYGIMPGDYAYAAFQEAGRLLPEHVALNINDYLNTPDYARQVIDLQQRGARIDIVGSQMHLFDPRLVLQLAEGQDIEAPVNTPQQIWEKMASHARPGLPLHLSEITITSGENDTRGQQIQAIITRNLYRTWFAVKEMMGITWWNLVDDCGAPGEPSFSGVFSRNMEPKPAFHVLQHLINEEWKTRKTLQADREGTIAFRGFRGRYRASWVDESGQRQEHIFTV